MTEVVNASHVPVGTVEQYPPAATARQANTPR